MAGSGRHSTQLMVPRTVTVTVAVRRALNNDAVIINPHLRFRLCEKHVVIEVYRVVALITEPASK